MPSPDLHGHAVALLDALMARHPLPVRPALEWRRYRTTAGMARWSPPAILLGIALLDTPERVTETLVHEYAHLLAIARHGKRGGGHGNAWKAAMRDLGAEPVVRHKMACQRNQVRQAVVYRCRRCGVEIVRRRSLPRGRRFVHAGCGGDIAFVRRAAPTPPAESA